MAIDAAAALALAFDPVVVDVEAGRLRFFALATGQQDPIYRDPEAAQAAGLAGIPVPPTFFFSLGFEGPDPFGYLDALGIDLRSVLHGEQHFEYHAMAYAGDRLTVQDRIVDVYEKKGGQLEFLVKSTQVMRDDVLLAELRNVTVVRHGQELS